MFLFRPLWLGAASGLFFFAAGAPAHAEGVRAGTVITNTASASYESGGAERTVQSNALEFRVDELIDVAVASQDGAPVPSSGQATLTFSVTNTGNGPEAFVLTADPAVAGNPFNPAIVTLAIDSNGNGVYDEGDQILANGGLGPELDPDASITVFVIVDTEDAPDGQTVQVALLAEAQTGTGTPGTVFAGQGEGGGDAVVGTSGADDQDEGAIVTSVSAVALQKTATVLDPFGGSEAVPGAVVTFRIVAQVSGSGSVANLRVVDDIPASTSYRPGSLQLNGAPLTDAADTDAGQASAAGIAVQLGTIAAGENPNVTFDVIID